MNGIMGRDDNDSDDNDRNDNGNRVFNFSIKGIERTVSLNKTALYGGRESLWHWMGICAIFNY